jgi:hypothetical protein
MKHLKTYQLFESKKSGLTQEQVKFLDRFTNGKWTYDPTTGLVNIDGDFDCSLKKIKSLQGIRFGQVSRDFICSKSELASLDGAPKVVGRNFWSTENKLTSLEGAPKEVGGDFHCSYNKLASLEGSPQKIGGDFECSFNKLTSLFGGPQKVGGNFECSYNDLASLKGAPKEVGGNFHCDGNRLESLEGAPQKVGASFSCDAFSLGSGEWNPDGWMEVFVEGSPDAQKLIMPFLTPEELNQQIQKDPEGTMVRLKRIWNRPDFRETRSGLVFPRGYEGEMDLMGTLSDVGL